MPYAAKTEEDRREGSFQQAYTFGAAPPWKCSDKPMVWCDTQVSTFGEKKKSASDATLTPEQTRETSMRDVAPARVLHADAMRSPGGVWDPFPVSGRPQPAPARLTSRSTARYPTEAQLYSDTRPYQDRQ